jgi:hypothetical protein
MSATCLAHLIPLDLMTIITSDKRVQNNKHLIIQFPLTYVKKSQYHVLKHHQYIKLLIQVLQVLETSFRDLFNTVNTQK